MKHPVVPIALAAALTLLAGCVTHCYDIGIPSLYVSITDDAGAPVTDVDVAFLPADADWTDYSECENAGEKGLFLCGWGTTGDIEIEIIGDGFQTHVETVFVEGDECDHPLTEEIDVVLQPTTS